MPMNEVSALRWRRLALPCLLIFAAFTAGYPLATWILFRVLNLEEPHDGFVTFFAATLVPLLPAWLWILPNARRTLEPSNGQNLVVMALLPAFLVGVASLLLAMATWEATAPFARVAEPSAVLAAPDADILLVDRLIDIPQASGAVVRVEVRGKYNESLDFNAYLVSPLVDPATMPATSGVWVAETCYKSISNRGDEAEKEAKFQQFLAACDRKFRVRRLASPGHFERTHSEGKLEVFREAAARAGVQDPARLVFLEPMKNPHSPRGTFELWFGIAMAAVALAFGYLLCFSLPMLASATVATQDSERVGTRLGRAVSALLDPKLAATKIFLALITVMFVASAGGGNALYVQPARLIEFGANATWLTRDGEWWRLLTAMTLHAGIYHLAMNGGALLLLGAVLEPRLGHARFALAFVATGIAGGLATLAFGDHTTSVGASGGIFGLIGMLVPLAWREPPGSPDRGFFLTLFGIYGLVGLVVGVTGMMGSVDNAAHIGGMLAGMLIGLVMSQRAR